MLMEPKCWTRKCAHYVGVYQPDGTEMTERHVCKAFPKKGIPSEIAYGTNLHKTVRKDQTDDFVYEKETA